MVYDAEGLDPLLPWQLVRHETKPELKLYAALLEDAAECLMGHGAPLKTTVQVQKDAETWVRGDSGNTPCVTFAYCCEVLGLNPAAVRLRLLTRLAAIRVGCVPTTQSTRRVVA